MPASRPQRWFRWIVLCALIGLGVFGASLWHVVDVERVEPDEAARRLDAVRASRPGQAPLPDLDESGRPTGPSPAVADGGARPIVRIRVLAWRAPEGRLYSAGAPFWFVKLKGPAASFALQRAGLDLDRLQLMPTALQRYGPAVIVDHRGRDGSRLLAWTE
jgi:hypothetical protein